MIPGHVLEKNTRNLYTFFSFLFQQKIRPHGRLYGHLCKTRASCVQRLSAYPGRKATCPLSSCSNKNDGPRCRFNCISIVSCKGSVCVEVLTSFYGRFFVEEGQFIKYTPSKSSLHFRQPSFSFIASASLWRALLNLPEVNHFTGNCFRTVRIVLKITFLKLKYPKGVTGRLPLCPIRELKVVTFSGRRRPDLQSKPGTEAAVAYLQNSNIKTVLNSGGRSLGRLPKRKIWFHFKN